MPNQSTSSYTTTKYIELFDKIWDSILKSWIHIIMELLIINKRGSWFTSQAYYFVTNYTLNHRWN